MINTGNIVYFCVIVISLVGVSVLLKFSRDFEKNDFRLIFVLLSAGLILTITFPNIVAVLPVFGYSAGNLLLTLKNLVIYSGSAHFAACFTFLVLKIAPRLKKTTEKFEKTKEEKEFLSALIRQDMKNKISISTGFMELIDNTDIPPERQKDVKKAIEVNKRILEIISLAEEVKKIEDEDPEPVNISSFLDDAIKNCRDYLQNVNIEIINNRLKESIIVQGSYTYKKLFSIILKTCLRKPDCDKIRISVSERQTKTIVSIQDNGKKIPDKDKENLAKGTYNGRTTELGGPIYIASKEILKRYEGNIDIKDSDLGGTQLDVHLQKAEA